VILAAADLGHSIQLSADGENVSSAEFYSPIIKMATFVSILLYDLKFSRWWLRRVLSCGI
jgi:hypothetical protein